MGETGYDDPGLYEMVLPFSKTIASYNFITSRAIISYKARVDHGAFAFSGKYLVYDGQLIFNRIGIWGMLS